MPDRVPVETGQWRNAGWGSVLAVLGPHSRRRGWWLVVSSSDSPGYYVESVGRRYLESLPLVENLDYFGPGEQHPGERSVRNWAQLTRQMDE